LGGAAGASQPSAGRGGPVLTSGSPLRLQEEVEVNVVYQQGGLFHLALATAAHGDRRSGETETEKIAAILADYPEWIHGENEAGKYRWFPIGALAELAAEKPLHPLQFTAINGLVQFGIRVQVGGEKREVRGRRREES